MTEETIVSIIVPVYNAEQYLERCISSIVKQTYSSIELILIDDGSTDRSSEICSCWKNRDSRIKYYRQENKGVSAARNRGLDLCTGEYVFFTDADDYLDLTCIRKYIDAQKESMADLVVGNAVDVYEDGTERLGRGADENTRLSPKMAVFCFLEGNIFTAVCWGRLYKRSCIENIRFDTAMSIAEDGKFFLNAINNCDNIYVIQERLYYYCRQQGSAVRSGYTEKYYDELSFCGELINTYHNDSRLELSAMKKMCRFILRMLRMKDLPSENYNTLRKDAALYYKKVKMYMSAKEKIKYFLLTNPLLRRVCLKVLP